MKLPLRIALRYVYSRKSFNFITIITLISFIGITAGVAALICVMSIFNGFRDIAEKQIVGFDPHIRIVSSSGATIQNADSLLAKVLKIEGVDKAASVIQGRVVGIKGSNLQVFTLNAIPVGSQSYSSGIVNSVIFGSFDITDRGIPGIVIGAALADRIRVLPFDTVYLMSPAMIEKSIRTFHTTAGIPFLVTGIFQTNVKDYDITYGFTSDEAGMSLFSNSISGATSIDVRLKSIDNVSDVKEKINSILPSDTEALTWFDLNKDLYRIMQFERMASFVILSLIIVIAVFNILASLSMTVVEKRRDIAVLKAMGATSKFIRNIFVTEGMIIGFFGSVAGSVLGISLCYGQIYFKWFKIDTAKYIIDAIPVTLSYWDVAIVFCVSVVLSFAATLFPSKSASETVIIQAIREE